MRGILFYLLRKRLLGCIFSPTLGMFLDLTIVFCDQYEVAI